MVIGAALAGEAAWVVTGGEDLLSLKAAETVSFETPREFLVRLDDTPSGVGSDAAPDVRDEA
jgi:predicted nucleic acid-binding protein